MTELTARVTDPASGVPELIRCALERMIADIQLIEENV